MSLASANFAPPRYAWLRFASRRSAPSREAPPRLTALRFAMLKFLPLRSASVRSAMKSVDHFGRAIPLHTIPLTPFHLPESSFLLHWFHTSTPCLRISRSSWFAIQCPPCTLLFVVFYR